ncbi:MAG: N-acetylneuraminate lyase [Clostridia bacterium]|nr:N-acetylneuraminate lyase [Clostridia bacterium]
MKEKFQGIFTALLTPFDKDFNVNHDELRKLIEMNIEKGVSGFYVCGSTGEAFMMTEAERVEVMKTVAQTVNGRCTLIAHIGAISQMEAIRLAKKAEEFGYDAVSSVAPFYYKFSFEEIKRYYFAIVDSVNIPMILYNIPLYSGVSMNEDNLAVFLNDDRFLGVKHTSNDYYLLERMKKAFPDKVFFNGFDEMLLPGLIMGADGAIGSTYNFMPDKFVKLFAAFKNGDIAGAQAIQHEANDIIKALIKTGCVMAAEKEVLCLMGYDMGSCRPPFKTLSDEESNFLKDTVLPLL